MPKNTKEKSDTPAAKAAPKKRGPKRRQPLTTKQKLFVEAYLANGHKGKAAAVEAGYGPTTDQTMRQIASDNLRKPEINQRIQKRIDDLAATADEVEGILGAHLRADIADFEGMWLPDGRLDMRAAKAAGISKLIKKIHYEPVTFETDHDGRYCDHCGASPFVTRYTARIEFHDSQSAAKILTSVRGMLKEAAPSQSHKEWARSEMERLRAKGYDEQESLAIMLEADVRVKERLM